MSFRIPQGIPVRIVDAPYSGAFENIQSMVTVRNDIHFVTQSHELELFSEKWFTTVEYEYCSAVCFDDREEKLYVACSSGVRAVRSSVWYRESAKSVIGVTRRAPLSICIGRETNSGPGLLVSTDLVVYRHPMYRRHVIQPINGDKPIRIHRCTDGALIREFGNEGNPFTTSMCVV